MPSNAARGSRAKARTKKWLVGQGFQVADMEKMQCVRPGVFVKRDQFASDLLAVNTGNVIFVQVKSGEAARTGTFPQARKAFAAFQFPSSNVVQQWIIGWPPRTREPRVFVCGYLGRSGGIV